VGVFDEDDHDDDNDNDDCRDNSPTPKTRDADGGVDSHVED
jgi:hypothetical protein